MGRIIASAEAWLQAEEWPYVQLDDERLQLAAVGDNGQYDCVIREREAEEQLKIMEDCFLIYQV